MRNERYRIIDEIGEGYYARVVRAWDRQRGSEVAIKYAKPFEDARMKIHHEFSVLAKLNHPNVVKVFDFEDWGKNPYFTSEYVPGPPITEFFKNRSLAELPNIMYQLLAGLASIHAQGYLHLDLKPDNILVIAKQTYLKILDLGFAELMSEKSTPAGTIGYLAPELLGGGRVDYRADLYSIGVILYEIYTGRPPFDLKSPISTLKDQLSGKIPEPVEVNPKLRPRINSLIMRLLSPDPMARPSTCHELFAEFEATFRRRGKRKKKQVVLPEMSGVIFSPGIIGREEEIARFEKILPIKGCVTYALVGDNGFGKSTLINHFSFNVQLERIENLKYIPSHGCPSLFQRLIEHLSLDIKNSRPDNRLITYEAVFRSLKEDLPFALIIDDAQALSQSDLEILRYITFGFCEDDPFLLLIAGEHGEWESIVESLKDVHWIHLGPFDRSLVEEILSKMFGVIINPHWLSSWIYQKTGGHPREIIDVVNLAFKIGAMKFVRGGWEYDPVRLEALESPESLIEPTIDSLSDRLKFAVEALMVSSSPVPLSALYLALRGEEIDLGKEFKRLWFIEEVKTPTGSAFRIRGEGLRWKMVEGLAKKKRSDTAAGILKAMEKISKDDGKERIFILADLAVEAHLLRKIRTYCKKAAQIAYDDFLFDRALGYYNVLQEVGEAGVDEAIGDCYWNLGNSSQALEYYNRVSDSVDILIKRSCCLRNLDRFEEALEVLSLCRTPDPKVLVEKGAIEVGLGRFEQAEADLQKGIALVSKNRKDKVSYFRGLYYLAQLYLERHDLEKAEKMVRKAIDAGKKTEPGHQASALLLLNNIMQELGDQDGFEQTIKEASQIINEYGLISLKRFILERKMHLSHHAGDIDNSIRYARESLTIWERVGDQRGIIRALLMEGITVAYTLDIEEALVLFNRALRLAGDKADLKANALHNLSWLHYQIYDLEKAEELIDQSIAIFNSLDEKTFLPSSLALKSNILIKKGNTDDARDILSRCSDLGLPTKKARINLYITLGEFKKAKELLEECSDLDPDFIDLVELKILAARISVGTEGLQHGIDALQELIHMVSRTKYTLCYLWLRLEQVQMIIRNGGYHYLKEFKQSLEKIEDLIRDKDLAEIKRIVSSLREEAFSNLIDKGVKPEIGEVLRKLAEAVNLYMGGVGIFEEILDILIEASRAERGIIFLKGQSDLRIAAGRGIDRETINDARDFSTSIIKEVSSKPMLSNDAQNDEVLRERRSVQLNKIRSMIAAPLIVNNRPIGAIYLDSRVTANLFSDEHLHLLIGVAPLISSLIEKSNLIMELRSKATSPILDINDVLLKTDSKTMERIYEVIELVAGSNSTVLLQGETGVGKGILARLIHEKSRLKGNFVSVNCATLPETLFESEVFGYKKGAFTDARRDKPGLIEEADNGTLFLDEVTAIPVAAQAKLLQVLEEGRFRRLGETELKRCNIRLICATNLDIEEEVDSGKFRGDLLYRINAFHIKIPPLRHRPEDIEPLSRFLLTKLSQLEGKDIEGMTDDAVDVLVSYPWPGNIRELSNIIQRAVILARGKYLTGQDFENLLSNKTVKQKIIDILRDSSTIEEAADKLNVSRRTLYRMLSKYDINRKKLKS